MPKIEIPKPADMLALAAEYAPFIPRPAPRFVTESGNRVHGVIAQFSKTPDVYHAAEKVRDAGYTKWDVHTPFPIHGMEEAMGVKRSILPLMAMGGAIAGVTTGLVLQFGTTDWLYPTVVQGKPFDAWESFTPVTFELGILLTAFTCLFGMLALNGLPRFHHPLFNSERFLSVSDDTFMICIEATDPNFDPATTRELLEAAGAEAVELVEDDA